jgi:type II secretory pathway pseudopilin PulG
VRAGGAAVALTLGMLITHEERGATLIEAIVAGGLLVTLATGTATLVTLARRLGDKAEQLMAATTTASARLQVLRAVPWEYGLDGSVEEVAALAPSGGHALERNTPGYFEIADEAGQPVGGADPGAPAFTVRWDIGPTAGAAGDTRRIEVCVFAWPTPDGSPPLVCVASARTRQP